VYHLELLLIFSKVWLLSSAYVFMVLSFDIGF